MISATQVRPGMVIKWNNELYSIFKMNTARRAICAVSCRVKMRKLANGSMTEHRFSSEDKVERAQLGAARNGSTCTTTASTSIS